MKSNRFRHNAARVGRAAVFAVLISAGGARRAAALEPAFPDIMPLAATGTTVITSQRIEFDNRERRALFEGSVLVRDATMRMRSDRMLVLFDENEQPVRIEASGKVIMVQENRLARANEAVYDIAAGKMVLTGAAEVRRAGDLLKGDKITFLRDEDRIEVVPGTLILAPETRQTPPPRP